MGEGNLSNKRDDDENGREMRILRCGDVCMYASLLVSTCDRILPCVCACDEQ